MQNAYTAYFERLQGADLQKSTAYAADLTLIRNEYALLPTFSS